MRNGIDIRCGYVNTTVILGLRTVRELALSRSPTTHVSPLGNWNPCMDDVATDRWCGLSRARTASCPDRATRNGEGVENMICVLCNYTDNPVGLP